MSLRQPPQMSFYPACLPFDEQIMFEEWSRCYEEPTLDNPPNIAEVQQELARMTENTPKMKKLHGEVGLAYAQQFRSLTLWRLFPFNALPDDVILQIFRLGTFCDFQNRSAPIMPLIYSSVCKRWRDLALDASWLWTYLGFKDRTPYPLTQLFLERSKSAPLIIEIDFTDKRFDWEDDTWWPSANTMIQRLAILLPHINRWKQFYCCTDNWAPIYGALLALQNMAAPILKKIEFRQNFEVLAYDPSRPTAVAILAGGAPALREVVLHTVPIHWHYPPFHNLSVLELYRLPQDVIMSIEDFCNILHQSPNLRKLSLMRSGPRLDAEIVLRLPRLELLALEDLEFDGTPSDGPYTFHYALSILSMFITGPALWSLTIGGFASDSDLLQAVPLLRSFPHIKRLILSDIHFTPANAAQWLCAMPEVYHLGFEGGHTQKAVLFALANLSQPFLCPALKTLALFDVDYEALSAVVHMRNALSQPLRELVFDINDKDETAVLGPLRGMVDIAFAGEEWDSEDEWTGPDPSQWPMNATPF